jgi:MoxR-like ATPase
MVETHYRWCREKAQNKVAVPEEIINLLSDVRAFLQEKCEPPVYVSDRRLVKAVGLMQVCLLLLEP